MGASRPKVVIAYNEAHQDSSVADQDVIVQRDAVAAALNEYGYRVELLPCTLNLQVVADQLRVLQPDVVFNLVESLAGTDRLMCAMTLLLDALGLRYTGASTNSMLQTSGKITAKLKMQSAGLPTPRWWEQSPRESISGQHASTKPITASQPVRAIVKPVWEHASFGMDDTSVVNAADPSELTGIIQSRSQSTGRLHFAEEFIDGREFNLSVLQGNDGKVIVLPAAEIDFSAYPGDKPRIVGHNAKWCEDSFEYQQTPRRFEFPDDDSPIIGLLEELAVRCWCAFELNGYARVDFRVDAKGKAWILEVNVNPCLSPDAGFAAVLQRAHISFGAAIDGIVSRVLKQPH